MNVNQYTVKDMIGSGSNWKDAIIGAAGGLAEGMNRKGDYYVNSNWRGNGLANTHIGYLPNQNYRDYTSGAIALSKAFKRDKNKDEGSFPSLSTIFRNNRPYDILSRDIDEYARPDYYDIYSDNAGNLTNNYDSAISSSITDLINNNPQYGSALANYLNSGYINVPGLI